MLLILVVQTAVFMPGLVVGHLVASLMPRGTSSLRIWSR